MSSEFSEAEAELQQKLERSEQALAGMQEDLRAVDVELEELAKKKHSFEVLEQICQSLEELENIGATELWDDGQLDPEEQIRSARQKIQNYSESIVQVEKRRQSIVVRIGDQDAELDILHFDLDAAIEREENRKNEWLIERDADEVSGHVQVMPWARGYEEDQRFRKSLGTSVMASIMLAILVSSIALPIIEREALVRVPERVAKLVREELPPPPPPVPVEEPVIEEERPEPELEEPKLVDEQPPEPLPEIAEEPAVAAAGEIDTKEQVKSRGILAFRDSFASRANLRPTTQLGSQARVTSAGEDAVGRPQRSMVTSTAPGSSGGINLASISRDVGGGGQGLEGVQVSRVASSIGGGGGGGTGDRPLSGGSSAGRTDEEIQIVFDRYKAALYRLYNRELRKDPTLRGQLILRLTIEPDGSVSFCTLQSSDMDAPVLAQQVVDRVSTFDFGSKEDIVSVTIIYPIDFLPAA